MKRIATFLIFLLSLINISAQEMFSNKTNTVLETVIKDYPYRFIHLKKELVSQKAGISQFRSAIQVPGSLSADVVQTKSAGKEVLSWNNVIFKGNDFQEAEGRFKKLFDQIKNSIIKLDNQKPFILSGIYSDPSPSRPTYIFLELLPATAEMQKLKVLLSLENISNSWIIKLSVSDKPVKS